MSRPWLPRRRRRSGALEAQAVQEVEEVLLQRHVPLAEALIEARAVEPSAPLLVEEDIDRGLRSAVAAHRPAQRAQVELWEVLDAGQMQPVPTHEGVDRHG